MTTEPLTVILPVEDPEPLEKWDFGAMPPMAHFHQGPRDEIRGIAGSWKPGHVPAWLSDGVALVLIHEGEPLLSGLLIVWAEMASKSDHPAPFPLDWNAQAWLRWLDAESIGWSLGKPLLLDADGREVTP